MNEIKNTSMSYEETEGMKEVVGKKVVDNRGKTVGIMKNIHIDPTNLTIEGITIERGTFKRKNYIGKEYIGSLSKEGAMLTITPLTQYFGMKVIDVKGKEVGKVKAVYRTRKTNSAYALTVDRGLMRDDITLPNSQINKVGENIILNTATT